MRKTICRRSIPGNNGGGVVLILVIWVMVILLAIVGEFSYSMRTELNMTRNFKEEEGAYQSALAGAELAKLEILSVKEPFYVFKNEEGILVIGKEDSEAPVREGKIGSSAFSYIITDENGKLNINAATQPQLKYIVKNTGVDITEVDTIVDSIMDWRDTNDLHMLNGAEEDYYQSLDNPYSCKDGPFDMIEELLLVKGVTPEIFFGSKENDGEEKQYKGLVNYLTTWSSMKINDNTAPGEVLEAVLGTAHAENIMKQREAGPILSPIYGGSATSSVFSVVSTGTNLDGTIKRTIKTTFRRSGKKLEVIYWDDNFTG